MTLNVAVTDTVFGHRQTPSESAQALNGEAIDNAPQGARNDCRRRNSKREVGIVLSLQERSGRWTFSGIAMRCRTKSTTNGEEHEKADRKQ